MLYAFGVGEIPISISGDPGAGGPLEHTVRAVGPVSAAICRASPGDQLGVRGPFGSAWPLDAASGRHVVVVAGGLGLAPLRPALLEALARRERLEGLVLLCGGRTPGAAAVPRRSSRTGRPIRGSSSESRSTAPRPAGSATSAS